MISMYRPTRPDSTVTCRYCSAEISHACSSSVMYSNMTMGCCGCTSETGACPTCSPENWLTAEELAELAGWETYYEALALEV